MQHPVPFLAPGTNGGPRAPDLSGPGDFLGRGQHQSPMFGDQVPNYMYGEGEQFYHSLPWPWNVVPVNVTVNQSDYMKMMFNHSFSGKLEEYETFRGLFIPIKHAANMPIALKHYALAGSLKGQAQELVQGTLPTASGYALLINRLEENYGGSYRQLDRGMDRIRRLKEVKQGQCQDLEALVRAVDAVSYTHLTLPTIYSV